jgi:ketosteroid isomerase-like protein
MDQQQHDRRSCSAQESFQKICQEGGRFVEALLPPDVITHLVEAHRQVLLAGIRAGHVAVQALDERLARAEAEARRQAPSPGDAS